MSIADSTDLPPQPHTLYTAAEPFSEPRTCASCSYWRPAKPTDYRGDCELNVVYGATAFDFAGCAWHSANASAPPLPGDGDE